MSPPQDKRQERFWLNGAFQPSINNTVHCHVLQALRYEGYTEPDCHQAESRSDARGFLTEARSKSRPETGRHCRLIECGPELTRIDNEWLIGQVLQRNRHSAAAAPGQGVVAGQCCDHRFVKQRINEEVL